MTGRDVSRTGCASDQRRLRLKIEGAIDQLIALLDTMDVPFEDLEDSDEDDQCDDEGVREAA